MDHLIYCEQQTTALTTRVLQASLADLNSKRYEHVSGIRDRRKRAQQCSITQQVSSKRDQATARLASQNQLNFLRYRDNLPLRHGEVSALSAPSPLTEMEESFALSNAISHVQQAQQHPLWQINKRMALLRGGLISDECDNPLTPLSLCRTFQTTVLSLTVDARTRLLLYETFARAFRAQSSLFYTTINSYLREAGVLPNLLRPVNVEQSDERSPATANNGDALKRSEQRLDSTLQALQQAAPWPQSVARTFSSPSILPIDAYTQACREVQTAGSGNAEIRAGTTVHPRQTLLAFQQRLLDRVGRTGYGLNQGLLLHAELVTRLFEWLSRADCVAPVIRELIDALHTSYLGIAITDRSFFLCSNHPGRRLIDTICYHGSLWQWGQHQDQLLLPKIRHTLIRLSSAPAGERAALEHCWQELGSFVQDQLARSAQTEHRSVESSKGLYALESARAEAQLVVNTSLRQQAVGEEIAELLRSACTDLLTFALLRQGYGDLWDQARKLMDGIAMSVRGQLSREQITRFQRGQQRLIKATRSELAAIGYEGILAQGLLDSLQTAQNMALEKLATEEPAQSPAPDNVSKTAPTPPLEQLAPGRWYRFDTYEAQPLTLKLAWRSGTHFLFTDVLGREGKTLDAESAREAWNTGAINLAELPSESLTDYFFDRIRAKAG